MEFRPCIDIHNGKVKQIVGGSLKDAKDFAKENFVSEMDAAYYANMYKKLGIKGGHVIMLNSNESPYYQKTREQALAALSACPGFLQIGGGITADNAKEYIEAGASHVIVTSYVFREGKIMYDNLNKLVKAIGKEHICLDLSCRKSENGYKIVTDRWQVTTDITLTNTLLEELSAYCDEYLIHAVDVEGKKSGIETELIKMLGNYRQNAVTYAGGISSYDDLFLLANLGKSAVNFTIGSALDIFGGNLSLKKVLSMLSDIQNSSEHSAKE